MYYIPMIPYSTYLHACKTGTVIFTGSHCNDLSTPANGEVTSCSSGRVGVGYEGDTCSFTCNTGYELTGSDTRTCQSDGSWSGSDDVCRRGRLYKILLDVRNYILHCNYVCSHINDNMFVLVLYFVLM